MTTQQEMAQAVADGMALNAAKTKKANTPEEHLKSAGQHFAAAGKGLTGAVAELESGKPSAQKEIKLAMATLSTIFSAAKGSNELFKAFLKDKETPVVAAPSLEAEEESPARPRSGAPATGGGSGQTGRSSFLGLGNDSVAAGPM